MNEYNEALNKCLNEHLDKLKTEIKSRSDEIAKEENNEMNIHHLTDAINEFAPGNQINDFNERQGFFANLSPFTLISSILAVTFAILGLWASNGQNGLGAQGFLDIAKIFAGAIVGSATKDFVFTKKIMKKKKVQKK